MKWMLNFEPVLVKAQFSYEKPIVLIGSCFSDNVGGSLAKAKFPVVHNCGGIVFDAISISNQLIRAAKQEPATEWELIELNGLWNSWGYHSRLSSPDKQMVVQQINAATQIMYDTLKQASHLCITLGTAYSYVYKAQQLPVANCHKAPSSWFEKKLVSVDEMTTKLKQAISSLREINPDIHVVFTVSPVKHIRDGIVENVRSKARLIETAHLLAEEVNNTSYFPAFEFVTEVLRDYRFYTKDMAHPNELAIDEVFELFCKTYTTNQTQQLMKEVLQLVNAILHKPLHADSAQYNTFLQQQLEKVNSMALQFPKLDWKSEIHQLQLKIGLPEQQLK